MNEEREVNVCIIIFFYFEMLHSFFFAKLIIAPFDYIQIKTKKRLLVMTIQ